MDNGQSVQGRGKDARWEQQADKLSHRRLRVYGKARALLRRVSRCSIGDAELRSQASRAANSVACNVAEGAALEGASKKKHYRIAKGSVVDVVAAYELAADIGETVPLDEVTRLGAAIEISSMLTGLTRK